MKDRLIKLLMNIPQVNHAEAAVYGMKYVFGCVADYLIAHGVTVQGWRPVTEPPKEAGEYIVMIKNGASATTLLFDGEFWFEENGDGEMVHYAVTHWMPLPEPPKGE